MIYKSNIPMALASPPEIYAGEFPLIERRTNEPKSLSLEPSNDRPASIEPSDV